MCMCVCLNMCLCTTCLQSLQRTPETGVTESGTAMFGLGPGLAVRAASAANC